MNWGRVLRLRSLGFARDDKSSSQNVPRECDVESAGRRGFTLLELLIVIAIIMVLTGMLLTGAAAARRRAIIAKAESETRELAKAWKSYWMTYDEWPTPAFQTATNMAMDGTAMGYLMGNNGMELMLMDLDMKVKTYGFKDPWGNFYVVDFSRTISPGVEYYETTVFLPQRKRYTYGE